MSNSVAPKVKEFARHLLAYESTSGKSASPKEAPSFRVCEKLRMQLAPLLGVGGFRSLLSRALILAGTEVAGLQVLQIKADGSLEGLHQLESEFDFQAVAEGQVVLVSHLLGLLLTFIGPALTLRLVHDIWPKMKERFYEEK